MTVLWHADDVKASHKDPAEIDRLINQPHLPQLEKVLIVQGELISTNLFQLYLEESGQQSNLISASDFVYLDQNDEPNLSAIATKLSHTLSKYPDTETFITQGFICRNITGGIDNLKRGGSDYSAIYIGPNLNFFYFEC